LGAVTPFSLKADLIPQRSVLSLVEENDAFVGRDEHYTQGAQLTYLEAEDRLPRWLTNFFTVLPAWGFSESLGRAGVGIGQKLYTPKNLALSTPQLTDRPYAGWLYFTSILQRRGSGWWNLPMQESLQLDAGIIGPAALGERAQNVAHVDLGLGGSPQGWDNQLPNEPAFELKYARLLRWQFFTDGNFAAEVLPGAGLSLGTVNTSLRAGGTLRFGWRLPEDYGPSLLDSLVTASGGRPREGEDHDGVYFFGGVVGRVVAYNAFLDGTAFRTSQSIDKENLVGDFFAGLVISLRYVDGGMTWVTRTREYSGQPVWDTFVSVFIRGRF
jgi:hypothetical protein